MCSKSTQFQSMSWTVDETVYELRHEGEKLALYTGRSHLLAMTLAEWKILSGVIGVFGQVKAAQADTTHHVRSGVVHPSASATTTTKPANMGTRWTETHDKDLAALWFKGSTLEQTGAEIGRTVPSVASRLVILDIEPDIESVYVENRSRRNKNMAPAS